jgi:2-polyprenyl-3-methyl-5-hydroxy-6-metoxy-1,4-benzoquinol methylase
MNWEETIKFIRTRPEYADLVEKAYFEEDLRLNVERFKSSEEFIETLRLLKENLPQAKTILDIGSGNGISAIAFALAGYEVTVSEPDPSDTIGAGAVRALKAIYNIKDLDVYQEFAENIKFDGKLFDVVYVRQAMHHAYNLREFVKNLAGLLRPGGMLFTVRDHVIFDARDKEWFLENHPLHKFYGGENAFTPAEYEAAIEDAGLTIIQSWKHFENVINYFPMTKAEYSAAPLKKEKELEEILAGRIGVLAKISFVKSWYKRRHGFDVNNFFNERRVPGRMYSYLAQKL